jgi:hypothetical protein
MLLQPWVEMQRLMDERWKLCHMPLSLCKRKANSHDLPCFFLKHATYITC